MTWGGNLEQTEKFKSEMILLVLDQPVSNSIASFDELILTHLLTSDFKDTRYAQILPTLF